LKKIDAALQTNAQLSSLPLRPQILNYSRLFYKLCPMLRRRRGKSDPRTSCWTPEVGIRVLFSGLTPSIMDFSD